MTAEQLNTVERLTADPRLVVRNPLTYSSTGRRPADPVGAVGAVGRARANE
jgi:hypothetical protein